MGMLFTFMFLIAGIISIISLCVFIYYKIKLKISGKKANENNEYYTTINRKKSNTKKTMTISFITCIVSFIIFVGVSEDERFENDKKKVASLSLEDKSLFDKIYEEEVGKTDEKTATEKGLRYIEFNKENLAEINKLSDEDKKYVESQYKGYLETKNEIIARDLALKDLKIKKENEKNELQKKYDDQAKYEEWVAYQKSEEEKQAAAELQKKYDDQAKYEEWIAWQKSEEEKANAERSKKRAGLNRLEGNGQIQYIDIGNNTYNIIITESATLNYSKNNLTDFINYATQSDHERNLVSTAKQCMELVQYVQDAEINVNKYTIYLTGEVVDGQGYKRIDNIVICEILGNAKFVRGDPYSFYNNCSRYWMIRGL